MSKPIHQSWSKATLRSPLMNIVIPSTLLSYNFLQRYVILNNFRNFTVPASSERTVLHIHTGAETFVGAIGDTG